MSDKLAAELRAEAKEMRRRDLLNPDRMFDGLHVAIVAFAQRFEDAAAALERAEREIAGWHEAAQWPDTLVPRLERAERVVEAARALEADWRISAHRRIHELAIFTEYERDLGALFSALAAYDTTRADTVRVNIRPPGEIVLSPDGPMKEPDQHLSGRVADEASKE